MQTLRHPQMPPAVREGAETNSPCSFGRSHVYKGHGFLVAALTPQCTMSFAMDSSTLVAFTASLASFLTVFLTRSSRGPAWAAHGYSEGCDADCDESASAHFGSPFDVGQEAEFHRREDGFSVLVDSESFTPTGPAFKRKQIAVM
jgi:hypothetical protein